MIFISILIIIVAIALPSFKNQLSPILLVRISSIILIYAGALSFNAFYIQSIGSGLGIYSGFYHVTVISQLLDTFLLIIGALIIIPLPTNFYLANPSKLNLILPLIKGVNSKNNAESNSVVKEKIGEQSESISFINELNRLPSVNLGGRYSLIILFSTLGSLLLVSSADLLSMYLSIELQSFGVYILATLFKDSKLATSAGLKYFLLGSLSSCLILLGAGLVYSYTGLTNLESIYSLLSLNESNSITQGLALGFILIIVGFLFKIAAAPLHHWAPDVYDDSPTIVTIWLTIMPKIAILIFLLEFIIGGIGYHITPNLLLQFMSQQDVLSIAESYSDHGNNILNSGSKLLNDMQSYSLSFGGVLKNLLLLSSLFSLIIGTVVGLVQSRIKRLLAYSTISHIGFILLALAINTEQSIESFIFYIIQYSITNLNTFLIILAFGYVIKYSVSTVKSLAKNNQNSMLISDKDISFISELKGQFISNPLLSLSLSICLFSMAGIPPLIGFFSKQMVLYSAVQNGYYFISIVAILVSVISASYYLKIVRVLFSEPENLTQATVPTLGTNGYYMISENSKLLELSSSIELSHKNENNKEFESKLLNGVFVSGEHLITNLHSFLISTLTLSILLFILNPSILLNSTQLLSLSLYNI